LDAPEPDAFGPFHEPLVGPALSAPGISLGACFPDGVYSEKDASLKYPVDGNLQEQEVYGYQATTQLFHIAFWVKPNWFPEASPRPHALVSLSPGRPYGALGPPGAAVGATNWYDIPLAAIPSTNNIPMTPFGLYYVPARNNSYTLAAHSGGYALGRGWPPRCLLWGSTHAVFFSEKLQDRGEYPALAFPRPMGRLQAHRWQHVALVGKLVRLTGAGVSRVILGRSAAGPGGAWNYGNGNWRRALVANHGDGTPNHLRFGEIAGGVNMNYMADATFANLCVGGHLVPNDISVLSAVTNAANPWMDTGSPGVLGRYLKEDGAAYLSVPLPQGLRPLRATWTEIPAELWFDTNNDGWLGDPGAYLPRNDLCSAGVDGPNGLRDVRIDLAILDAGGGSLGRFRDAGGPNRPLATSGAVSYKALFVNEWSPFWRTNFPLDVTPFLDDVTLYCQKASGPVFLGWEEPE
jgi:hypothetical protein